MCLWHISASVTIIDISCECSLQIDLPMNVAFSYKDKYKYKKYLSESHIYEPNVWRKNHIIWYDLRHSKVLYQPKWQKFAFRKSTLKNYGNRIRNWLYNEIKKCTDIVKFLIFIKIMGIIKVQMYHMQCTKLNVTNCE